MLIVSSVSLPEENKVTLIRRMAGSHLACRVVFFLLHLPGTQNVTSHWDITTQITRALAFAHSQTRSDSRGCLESHLPPEYKTLSVLYCLHLSLNIPSQEGVSCEWVKQREYWSRKSEVRNPMYSIVFLCFVSVRRWQIPIKLLKKIATWSNIPLCYMSCR